MSDITEGLSSLASDLDDTDSFATANLKVKEMLNNSELPYSVESSVSSISTVTAIQSPEASRDQDDQSDESKAASDINICNDAAVIEREEKEEAFDPESIIKEDVSGGASKESSPREELSLREEQSVKPRAGTYTILKRLNKEDAGDPKTTAMESSDLEQDLKMKVKINGKESKIKSRPMEEEATIRKENSKNSSKLGKDEKRNQVANGKKQKMEHFDPFEDDVKDSGNLHSEKTDYPYMVDYSCMVETGDLLGLNSGLPSGKQETPEERGHDDSELPAKTNDQRLVLSGVFKPFKRLT